MPQFEIVSDFGMTGDQHKTLAAQLCSEFKEFLPFPPTQRGGITHSTLGAHITPPFRRRRSPFTSCVRLSANRSLSILLFYLTCITSFQTLYISGLISMCSCCKVFTVSFTLVLFPRVNLKRASLPCEVS